MTKNEKISLGIAVGAAAAVWFLERRLNTSGTAGIGDVPVWNRGHIRNWFEYEHYDYPEKIAVVMNKPYYIKPGCLEVYSYRDRDAKSWAFGRAFAIKEGDVDYLREMCEKHGIKYIEY